MKGYLLEKNKSDNDLPYEDITSIWLEERKGENGICDNQDFFVDKNDNKYDVDGVNVILDHSRSEDKIARFYAKTKQIDVRMLPRVLNPKNVKTGGFIEETTGIIWEIKEPIGYTVGTTILNQFKNQKNKACHFIIDMHKSDMEIEIVIREIESILTNNRYNWIEEVIIMKNLQIKKVFRKK